MTSVQKRSARRRLLGTALLAVVIGFTGVACKRSASKGGEAAIPELSVEEVAQGIEQKTLSVFDNNSKGRFQKSHVPTAKWLAFNDVKASDLPPSKDTRLVFYCANEH